MRGVVAAGQPDTAAAAAHALRLGGNAVDAAIAAAAAAMAGEPLLANAGGAGMMTLALPGRAPAVLDFFSDMPGRDGRPAPDALDFAEIVVDFGVGAVTQGFHIGRAAAAVPGALPGLAEAHRQFGSLPLPDLLAPAISLAASGSVVTETSATVYRMLWAILSRDPETTAVLTAGAPPAAGDRLTNPALAETLRAFAAAGDVPERVWSGLLAEFGPARGGLISEADIRAFRPAVREPLRVDVGDWSVCLPPGTGGRLAALILQTLADSADDGAGDAGQLSEMIDVIRLGRASAAGHAARMLTLPGNTTHISVLDAHGGAAAVTLTNGEGCGHLISGTGIHINNFLGEEDLNPRGFHMHAPGDRLPTMIAPVVAMRDGVPTLALGSGGSNRIRTAVGQVLYRVVSQGSSLRDAVLAPRVHAEGDTVWVEAGILADPDAAVTALAAEFATVHRFPGRDFFFGGVHAVVRDGDDLRGIGDPRRGGACVVA